MMMNGQFHCEHPVCFNKVPLDSNLDALGWQSFPDGVEVTFHNFWPRKGVEHICPSCWRILIRNSLALKDLNQ